MQKCQRLYSFHHCLKIRQWNVYVFNVCTQFTLRWSDGLNDMDMRLCCYDFIEIVLVAITVYI